jgi:hypothetical protein
LLPVGIQAAGVSLQRQGINEVAFPLETSLVALDALSSAEASVGILGGEFWAMAESSILRPTYENWYVDRYPDEPAVVFVERSIESVRSEIVRRIGTGYFVTLTSQRVV